jgi:predicted nuclease of predicted toxin-antitoxin system
MRFIVDMNLTPRWVPYLDQAGYETVHWSAVGLASATDHVICAYAREHDYIVLTNDLDFPQILAHTRHARPSIVLVRGEPLIPEIRGPALLKAVHECETDLAGGAILVLDWFGRARARVLPIL